MQGNQLRILGNWVSSRNLIKSTENLCRWLLLINKMVAFYKWDGCFFVRWIFFKKMRKVGVILIKLNKYV